MTTSPRTSADLSEASFGKLWLARDVAALGDWVLFVALLAQIHAFSETPFPLISMLLLAFVGPSFLLGPILRRRVTWQNARAFGLVALLMRATVTMPLFLMERGDGVQPILIVAAGAALTVPFFVAAYSALLRANLAPDRRAGSVKLLLNTGLAVTAAGPVLGMVVFGYSGVTSTAAVSMVALLISAIMLILAGSEAPLSGASDNVQLPPEPGVTFASIGVFRAFGSAASREVAPLQAVTALLSGGLVVAVTSYMTNGLYVAIDNIGILLACQGIGIAVGVIGYFFLGRQQPAGTLLSAGLALIAGGAFGLAISTSLTAAAALVGTIGVGEGILLATFGDLVLGLWLPARAVGAGSGATTFLVEGAAVLSVAVMGSLSESLTPRFALVLIGILTAVLALYSFGAVVNGAPEGEEGATPRRSKAPKAI